MLFLRSLQSHHRVTAFLQVQYYRLQNITYTVLRVHIPRLYSVSLIPRVCQIFCAGPIHREGFAAHRCVCSAGCWECLLYSNLHCIGGRAKGLRRLSTAFQASQPAQVITIIARMAWLQFLLVFYCSFVIADRAHGAAQPTPQTVRSLKALGPVVGGAGQYRCPAVGHYHLPKQEFYAKLLVLKEQWKLYTNGRAIKEPDKNQGLEVLQHFSKMVCPFSGLNFEPSISSLDQASDKMHVPSSEWGRSTRKEGRDFALESSKQDQALLMAPAIQMPKAFAARIVNHPVRQVNRTRRVAFLSFGLLGLAAPICVALNSFGRGAPHLSHHQYDIATARIIIIDRFQAVQRISKDFHRFEDDVKYQSTACFKSCSVLRPIIYNAFTLTKLPAHHSISGACPTGLAEILTDSCGRPPA